MIEDAVLVKLFKDGISDAFNEIYIQYYKSVYNYINKMMKDTALADDLTQETLIKVLGGLMDADEKRSLSPWIFRIAHNTCVDYHRKNRASYELIEDIGYNGLAGSSPEHILLNKEKQLKVREALSMIGQKYRTVLLLRACKDLSYREIAVQLNINESTVKTLIHRGRQQLQKVYAEVY